ncbi:Na(+)/H(+) antiporter subunit B [Sporosarcina sp. Te-1]|uniref:Na(+)/H(+) antiporter subunit B n=1 Tax=Sporosarcina sp. Te-1 TaxID=2818390 RepID=UPI001A9E2A05|nr:Na(+)/H(+) antiporter subunit B [Sporosarcina sp. Te-1]QTD39622.1 Na(+)/H(+) antiporter subunit B [Sporosarcina sp. Te-1]
MEINDVILKTVTRIVVFIILTFGIELFLSGHHEPGGGFIGGLVLSSAFVLLYLVHDIETVHNGIPFDFKKIAALGAFLAVGSGIVSVLFGTDFLGQGSRVFDLPIFGETEISSVIVFEAGVALTVVGVVVTIILSISEDV